MSLASHIKTLFRATVNSGNIRYQAYPAAAVAIADDAAWDQLWAAGAGPTVDFWICGFQPVMSNCAADVTVLIDFGWGGADGVAVAAANVIGTNIPYAIQAQAVALGPTIMPIEWLPFPVKVPGGSRAAARIASSPTGTQALTEFRLICAIAVG
jgi:hypothetical protein